MARYKHIDVSPRFLAVDLKRQLLPGIVTGAVVAVLGAPFPLKGWLAFFGSLVLASVILGIYFGEPVEYLAALFSSPGNWFFFVGSIVWPGVAYVRRRAV